MPFARFNGLVQDDRGNAVESCTIQVRDEATGFLATLYSDTDGTAPLTNPFVSVDPNFFFHVKGGNYRIDATKGAFTRTWRWVPVGTAQSRDMEAIEQSLENLSLSVIPVGFINLRDSDFLPDGWLPYGEGGVYDHLNPVYVDFVQWMADNHPELEPGVLPDYRDYYPRTAGGALGPAVGEKQEDAMQRLTGSFRTHTGVTGWDPTGVFEGEAANPGGTGTGVTQTASMTGAMLFDSGNSPGARVSDDETRVKSVGFRWMIKAYGAFVNVGDADLVAIEQNYNTMVNNALLGDRDQTGKDQTWRDQAMANLGVPLTGYYESSQQTITLGGLLTLSHDLGAQPKLIQLSAVCIVAQGGYEVGENMVLTGVADHVGSSQAHGMSVRRTETDILIRFGIHSFCGLAINPTNGSYFGPTPASWQLIVRAFA